LYKLFFNRRNAQTKFVFEKKFWNPKTFPENILKNFPVKFLKFFWKSCKKNPS